MVNCTVEMFLPFVYHIITLTPFSYNVRVTIRYEQTKADSLCFSYCICGISIRGPADTRSRAPAAIASIGDDSEPRGFLQFKIRLKGPTILPFILTSTPETLLSAVSSVHFQAQDCWSLDLLQWFCAIWKC